MREDFNYQTTLSVSGMYQLGWFAQNILNWGRWFVILSALGIPIASQNSETVYSSREGRGRYTKFRDDDLEPRLVDRGLWLFEPATADHQKCSIY